jgi:lysyl-tRNA synthetase class 2
LRKKYSIREVIAFPFMKDEKKGEEKKLAAEEVAVEALPTEEARK